MSKITTEKQDNFIDSEKVSKIKVKIYGLGSIGSILAQQLALTGFTDITGYDMDTVDSDNVGSQLYTKNEVGIKKTEALKKLLKDWYDYDIETIEGEITKDTQILPEENTIYFCAFDSLEARQIVWEKLKDMPVIWGESRIGRSAQRFYFVDLKDDSEPNKEWIKNYEESLNPNGPRIELKCGDKGCFSSNAELVSKIVKQMVNIAENKPLATMMIGDWGTPPPIFIAPTEEVPGKVEYD